jgi:uncharacterized metal-binding protein YceD (DUF177 family)
VNYHNPGECTGNAVVSKATITNDDEEAVADSPFSVLKQLKH